MSNNISNKAVFICILGAAFVILQFVLQIYPGIITPQLMVNFQADITSMTIVSTVYYVPYLLLQMPAGYLVDKYGTKIVLYYSLAICSIACWLFALSKDYHFAIILRVIMGAASAPAISVAFSLIARWLPSRLYGVVVGLVESITVFATAIIALGFVKLIQLGYDWQLTINIIGAAGALLLLFIMLFVPPSTAKSHTAACNNFFNGFKLVLCNHNAWLVGLYSGIAFMIVSGFGAFWCTPYLEQLYHTNLQLSALGSYLIFIGAAIGAPLSSFFVERYQCRKQWLLFNMIIALLLSELILYFPPSNINLMYCYLFLLGGVAGSYVIPFAIIRDCMPNEVQALAVGFINMLSIAFGAPFFLPVVRQLLIYHASNNPIKDGQVIFDMYDYQYALSLLLILLAVAIICTLFIEDQKSKLS